MLYLREYLQAVKGEMSNRQFDMDVKLGEKSELRVSIWQYLKTSMDEITKESMYDTKSSWPRTTENINF